LKIREKEKKEEKGLGPEGVGERPNSKRKGDRSSGGLWKKKKTKKHAKPGKKTKGPLMRGGKVLEGPSLVSVCGKGGWLKSQGSALVLSVRP